MRRPSSMYVLAMSERVRLDRLLCASSRSTVSFGRRIERCWLAIGRGSLLCDAVTQCSTGLRSECGGQGDGDAVAVDEFGGGGGRDEDDALLIDQLEQGVNDVSIPLLAALLAELAQDDLW